MGYEITYHYKEEVSKGEYSEEVKTKTIVVGKPEEDLPLDVAAGKIIGWFARRNILIMDVEIYEYTKKKLSFKEADDGILIKNKKFKFDDSPVNSVAGEFEPSSDVEKVAALLAANPGLLQQLTGQQAAPAAPGTTVAISLPKQNSVNIAPPRKRVIRKERFDPTHPAAIMKYKNQFTMGQLYPIYEIITEGKPPIVKSSYMTVDNNGKDVKVPAEHFCVAVSGQLEGFENNNSLDLWDNGRNEFNVPDVLTYGNGR